MVCAWPTSLFISYPTWGWYHKASLSPQVEIYFTDRSKMVLLLWILFVIYGSCCHAFLSVHCRLVVTCWERINLLVLFFVMFSCVFVTFPCGVLVQLWFLVVSISDNCLIIYFFYLKKKNILAFNPHPEVEGVCKDNYLVSCYRMFHSL